MKNTIIKSTLALTATFAVAVGTASATYTCEAFPGCDSDSPVTLVGFDFENLSVGTMGDSVPASEIFNGFAASNIQGPGQVKIGSIAGSNWGCFGGFPSNGNTGRIDFTVNNFSGSDVGLNDITFDYATENRGDKNGPTKFRVDIFDATTGSLQWVSYKTIVTPGTENRGSFSLANIGDNMGSSFDGYNFTGSDDWATLADGEGYRVSIRAWGANTGTVGLDIDNVRVLGCVPGDPIPEPSTSLLAIVGASFLLIRRKR